jgi:transposase-like protein
MRRKRRIHSPAFKAKVTLEAINEDGSHLSDCPKYGIHFSVRIPIEK